MTNENYILKLVENNNNTMSIEKLHFNRYFDKLFNELENIIDSKNTSKAIPILNLISNDAQIKKLKSTYNYCKELDKPYQNCNSQINKIKNKLIEYSAIESANNRFSSFTNQKNLNYEFVLEKLKIWANADLIETAYKSADNDEKCKYYSHRKIGFEESIVFLNKDISIKVMSNFGFGSASYLCIIMTYKGIQIVPYTDWIRFRYAIFDKIINNSKSYYPMNDSWEHLLTYVVDACNLAATDEQEFVERYIINECEKMINELVSILTNEEFKVIENGYAITKYSPTGYYLTTYRSEKIRGALNFINNILDNPFIENKESIVDKILKINKNIEYALKIELPKIEFDINNLTKIIKNKKMQLTDKKVYFSENKVNKSIEENKVLLNDINDFENKINLLEKTVFEYQILSNKMKDNLNGIKKYFKEI